MTAPTAPDLRRPGRAGRALLALGVVLPLAADRVARLATEYARTAGAA